MNMDMKHFATVGEFDNMLGVETLHSLVSVVNLSEVKPMHHMRHTNGFYSVMLKDEKFCDLVYGRSRYDYDKGSVVCTAPGQVVGIEPTLKAGGVDFTQTFQPVGWGLFFHADLLRGTELGRRLKEYSFFSYNANEALHLSERERQTFLMCLMNIKEELTSHIDRLSRRLITSNIEILLDHCLRFYERQFATREFVNHDLLSKFEQLLDHYFEGSRAMNLGLPTVKYFAGELCLSANYFGDLLKKETGKTPKEIINLKVLEEVKNRLLDPSKSILQVSEEMGFLYPQHLTKFFKKETGITPNEYRKVG